jgi:hypothetical protein
MGKYKGLPWYEKENAGQKNLLIMTKAEAVKKLSALISEAFVNEDFDAIVMYADVIEQQLQAMFKLIRELKEILEKSRVESNEQHQNT